MERTPSSGLHYCSSNPSDSSDDSQKTESASLVIPNDGYHDQEEVDSVRVVSPAGDEDGTSDSERTASFGGIQSDGHGDVQEVNSVHFKDGDRDTRYNAEKNKKHGRPQTDQGKTVNPGHRQQGKGGLLKMLPEKKVVRDIGDSCSMWKNTEMDGKTGDDKILVMQKKNEEGTRLKIDQGKSEMDGETDDGKILLTDTKMVVPLDRVHDRKEYLPLPLWLKGCKSHRADLDGWQHWQVPRDDSYEYMRKDKYYRHRDYDHTFRSKKDVKHFLETGEVKGKGLLQKKSSDPGGQSYAPRRSRKRRMVLPANDSNRKQKGYGWSTAREMTPTSSKLPHGFV